VSAFDYNILLIYGPTKMVWQLSVWIVFRDYNTNPILALVLRIPNKRRNAEIFCYMQRSVPNFMVA